MHCAYICMAVALVVAISQFGIHATAMNLVVVPKERLEEMTKDLSANPLFQHDLHILAHDYDIPKLFEPAARTVVYFLDQYATPAGFLDQPFGHETYKRPMPLTRESWSGKDFHDALTTLSINNKEEYSPAKVSAAANTLLAFLNHYRTEISPGDPKLDAQAREVLQQMRTEMSSDEMKADYVTFSRPDLDPETAKETFNDPTTKFRMHMSLFQNS